MKKLFLTLLLATLCSTAYGQTIKSLGYNTTNNRVVGPTSTNALVFTNVTSFEVDAFFNGGDIRIGDGALYFGGTERINLEENRFAGEWTFDQPASWRTNLGLGATWLTNDNVTNFRTAIELGETNDVRFNTIDATSRFRVNDGSSTFLSLADDVAEFFTPIIIINGGGLDFGGTNAADARANTRTNLGLYNTNEASVYAALALWDGPNDTLGFAVNDGEIVAAPSLVGTNAPTNATNAVGWIIVNTGTNAYYLPLFQ
jgi:hypothetical protein